MRPMATTLKHIDEVYRRTCDNDRCADPAVWKCELRLGDDVKPGGDYHERTGPYTVRANLCQRHCDELKATLKGE